MGRATFLVNLQQNPFQCQAGHQVRSMHPTITGTLTLRPRHAPGSLQGMHRVARQAQRRRASRRLRRKMSKVFRVRVGPGQRSVDQHRTARAHARRDQLRGRAAHRIQRRICAAAACSGSIQDNTLI